eukprot:TRINITY_DN8036_c0_g1_i1.p1 TRINITY_DN8036_c0_g1~~TRINITY_DN8036_c0_g1_i1.p1  ORF type:complete len:666 (-),score=157.32 TRINITY_DN8036_c0_g1_i1:177-2174(-)
MVNKRNKREDSFDRAEKAAEAAAKAAAKAATKATGGYPAKAPAASPSSGEGSAALDAGRVLTVTEQHHSLRIDAYLALCLPSKPTRGRLQRALQDGGILLNGLAVKKVSTKVRTGDRVEWVRDAERAPPGLVEPEKMDLQIYHEDEFCIVLEKPAGMCVHPAGGLRSGTLVNALLYHTGYRTAQNLDVDESSSDDDSDDDNDATADAQEKNDDDDAAAGAQKIEGSSEALEDGLQRPEQDAGSKTKLRHDKGIPELPLKGLSNLDGMEKQMTDGSNGIVRPGIVHRLDRGTSGVMVAAKQDAAHAALAAQFAQRKSKRRYVALVWGVPKESTGKITGPIGRDPGDRLRMTVVGKGKGKPAVTHYTVIEKFDGDHVSLVRFELETGRTHQVRVHARHIGHPLLGDATYGGAQLLRGPKTASRIDCYSKILPDVGKGSQEGCLKRPALHAESLGFYHPDNGRWIDFTSELPDDMSTAVSLLRDPEKAANSTGSMQPGKAADSSDVKEKEKKKASQHLFKLTVDRLNGTSLQISVMETDTIEAVKAKIKEKTGIPTNHQNLILGTDVLEDDKVQLGKKGIGEETPLQLVLVKPPDTYTLQLMSITGPNTPRFGCSSTYRWKVECSCGYVGEWIHNQGYDFYSYEELKRDRKCPGCGGNCGGRKKGRHD